MRIRVREVGPAPDSDCDAAYAVQFDDGVDPGVMIEYAAGGRDVSSSHARHLVQDFLTRGEVPPRRILVDRAGNARPR